MGKAKKTWEKKGRFAEAFDAVDKKKLSIYAIYAYNKRINNLLTISRMLEIKIWKVDK